jgi:hypothetical protein
MHGQGLHGLTYDSLDIVRQMALQNNGHAIFNSFTQPTRIAESNLTPGIQYFDFDPVGRDLTQLLTPLTNRIPRGKVTGGTAMAWREITDWNPSNITAGVQEGKRGARPGMTTRNKLAFFAGLGVENAATFESQYAAKGVADPKNMGRLQALKVLRQLEEYVNMAGNASILLGTPAAPSGVAAATSGSESSTMTARTVLCRVVALTDQGVRLSSVASGVATVVNRTNADGTTTTHGGGSSLPSAASTGVVVGSGQKVTWSVADVRPALGYAWFTGTASGTCRLAGITRINQFVQYADEGGTAQLITAITADNSKNETEYDGMFTQVLDTASGAYFKDNNAGVLTADSTGNIQQFVEAFYAFATGSYKTGIEEIHVAPLEAYAITKILLNGSMKDVYSAMVRNNSSVIGGFYVSAILNPFTGQTVPIVVNPVQPEGFIGLFTWNPLIPIPDLGNVWEIVPRQPYYVIEWPLTSREHQVGVYCDQGLKCEASFLQGAIKNVKSSLT